VIKQERKEYLSGTIERITFHNPENGFCVLRVKVKGYKDLVTILGSVPSVSVGEYIKCSGLWHNDRNHGKQFKADFLKSVPPDTLEGIEKYLGSGLIRGIGPHFAKKLVVAFKEKVFDIIEFEPNLLSTVEGIGVIRAQSICKNWQDQKIIREIMVFLQSHGVGTTRATRIYKRYGEKAIETVSSNPYQLAKDIRGIGFVSADTIASNLRIAKDSIERAKAGVAHVLLEATSDGHCGLPKDIIVEKSQELLKVEKNLIETAILEELKQQTLTLDNIDNQISIFLTSHYIYEKQIAKQLLKLSRSPIIWNKEEITESISVIETELNIKLAENQKEAIKIASKNKVMVITGGPGTGKTTLVKSLLRAFSKQKLHIKLCAPSGRAAKRLSETTNMEATTIHRLLEIDPTHGGFKRNENNHLSCDYLVVDESSMVDIPLFYSLLKALPSHTALLLVGDINQLPSVGAGQALKDIIESKTVSTIYLTEIFRQAADSDIVLNAHKINQGLMPNLSTKQDSDFYFIEAELGDDITNKIITLVKERIPKRFGFNSIHDIQVLCPMQRGGAGARSVNTELQKTLNPNSSEGITKFGQLFAVGDKVMQTENNYDKEVYNGDIGIITSINEQDQEISIDFYDKVVVFDYTDLDQVTLAYATTIHKSQLRHEAVSRSCLPP